MAIAVQTAVNALWFAMFEEPYPGETLQSLRFAALLGGLVLLAIAFVSVWEMLKRKENRIAPKGSKGLDIDPVAIARNAVVQRLPNATIGKWHDEAVVEEDAYIEVKGMGVNQTLSIHPFRVRMTKQGSIVQEGTYVH
jgi:hypothetical protein